MAFKKPTARTGVPDSPDRLFRDLPRRKHPSLFDHQGQILRTYASDALTEPDVALQLPTGSGKTLVGLLLAEWRRRKFGDRVVYLCPTRQLVNQVVDEARHKYGLLVEGFTGQATKYMADAKAAYHDSSRIAITTYSSLFNSYPFFKDPNIIVLDDAHVSENYIASQWTLRIDRSKEADQTLFAAVASVLKKVVPPNTYARLLAGQKRSGDPTLVDKLPTNKLMEIINELGDVISENVISGGAQQFAWNAIADNLGACQLYFSKSELLIRPLIPPTWTVVPFAAAKQRVFMSATLGAGGDLERLTGRPTIVRLPIPDGWDRQGIGRRFFMFPEKSLESAECSQLRRSLMKAAGRSLVLTQSEKNAKKIVDDVTSSLKFPVFKAVDLESKKADFSKVANAVAVIANRYDGIDFPDDECRLLFVEGLPRTTNLQERFLMNRMGANLLFNERVQARVLQSIGRCTRGLNDYSAVVVSGEDLSAYFSDRARRGVLHPELQAELSFGIEQSTDVDAQTMLENFRTFITHGAEWETANEAILAARETASQVESPAMKQLAATVKHEIAWQRAMWDNDYGKAHDRARDVLGELVDPLLRGYRGLWHYLAGSAAELACESGQLNAESNVRIQFGMAKEAALGIPWLASLAHRYERATVPDEPHQKSLMDQIECLELYIANLGVAHNRTFAAREKSIRDGLKINKEFEQAQVQLGKHLGFNAGKVESDASPDPWWLVGDIAFVFEDHVEANGPTAVIDATKARQAASHPNWLREHVPEAKDAKIYPILLTPATKFRPGARPHLGSVLHWDLTEFRDWAERALVTVREIRGSFVEPGDLSWRNHAGIALTAVSADAPGLVKMLLNRPARDTLTEVP